MNFHTRRVALAEAVEQIDPLWHATTQSWPDWGSTYTAQVWHVAPTPETFKGGVAAVPLRLWVNEGNDSDGALNLYDALSGDDGSLLAGLRALDWVKAATVESVGMQEVAGTWFTLAELTVRVRLTT